METPTIQTANHNAIKRWILDRGGKPAVMPSLRRGEGPLLRIDFGENDEKLEAIAWDDFFRIFDERNLAFLYEDEAIIGGESRFFKFVSRAVETKGEPEEEAKSEKGEELGEEDEELPPEPETLEEDLGVELEPEEER